MSGEGATVTADENGGSEETVTWTQSAEDPNIRNFFLEIRALGLTGGNTGIVTSAVARGRDRHNIRLFWALLGSFGLSSVASLGERHHCGITLDDTGVCRLTGVARGF